MRIRQIDAAQFPMARGGERIPFLRDGDGDGPMARAARDDLIAALRRVDEALFASNAKAPVERV
jgi:hypothetical protein